MATKIPPHNLREIVSSLVALIENPEIRRQSLTFSLNGNFLVVGSFIEELEKNKSPLKIHNCSIRRDSLDPLGVIAKLEYLTYAGQDL